MNPNIIVVGSGQLHLLGTLILRQGLRSNKSLISMDGENLVYYKTERIESIPMRVYRFFDVNWNTLARVQAQLFQRRDLEPVPKYT